MKRILVMMIVLTICMSLLFTYAIHIPFSYAVGSSPTTHPIINTTNSDTVKTSDGLELFYTVTVEKDKPTFHVNIEIKNLNPGEFTFCIFSGRENLEEYISNLQVRNQTTTLTVAYLGNFAWKVYQNGGVLFIDYDMSKIIPFHPIESREIGQKSTGVYIDNECGMLIMQFTSMVPWDSANVTEIKIKFNLPADWQIVTPYIDRGPYYEVPQITNSLVRDFVQRQGIYFGKMKFYAESNAGDCVVKFGVFEDDQSNCARLWLAKEEGIQFYVQRVVLALNELTKMFGENPYPVFPMFNTFQNKDGWMYEGAAMIAGGNMYWSPERYDEVIGHLQYSWMCEKGFAPAAGNTLITKGIGESYLGNKLAYEITGDETYLGKIYHYYLVYKAAQGTKYASRYEIKERYYRGCVIGIWLDNLIQKETNGKNSIEDAIGYLYQKYKNIDHEINNKDLELAIDLITNQDHSALYKKYLDGYEDIPVEEYIQPYKDGLDEFVKVLASDNWMKDDYRNYTIPLFVDIEMAIISPIDLPMGILILDHYRVFAKYVLGNYDVNTLTKEDAEASLSKLTGEDCTGFFDRWKDSYGELSLEEMKEWLKNYLPYSPTNLEATFKNNSVSLKWNQVEWRYPSGYYEVTGYTIYRGTSSGEEALIATVSPFTSTYTDTNIEVGKTYYYYVRTIENLFKEMTVYSDPSDEVTVVCADTAPPRIEINSPADNSVVDTNTIHISGMAIDDESGIDKVTVNGSEVSVDYGFFSKTVNLIKGTNTITIIATDKEGNTATKTITVTYTLLAQEIVITLQPDNPMMTVNDVSQEIDLGRGTTPVIIPEWGRTVVPIRAIVEALGGTISWDGTERKVTINFKGTVIELWIDNPQARVNGTEVYIDPDNHNVKPIIVNDRTMLPLRFVAESLGCEVGWDNDTRTITITYGG